MKPQPVSIAWVWAIGLIVVFFGQWATGPHSDVWRIDVLDLTTFGAVSGDLVARGEVWRVVTAPLLHAGVAHLMGNAAAIVGIGRPLEAKVGGRWLALTIWSGGVGGAVSGLAWNPGNAISVGASGSVCAILVTNLVLVQRQPGRPWTETGLGLALVASALIPWSGPDGAVDIAAHLGGAGAGLVMGIAVQPGIWRTEPGQPRPIRHLPRRAMAAPIVASTLALVAAVGAGIRYRERYAAYAPSPALVAARSNAGALDQLVEMYPGDPRPAVARAGVDLQTGSPGEARRRLEDVLRHPHAMHDLGRAGSLRARVVLVYATLLDGDADQAGRLAAEICPAVSRDRMLLELARDMAAKGLCRTP